MYRNSNIGRVIVSAALAVSVLGTAHAAPKTLQDAAAAEHRTERYAARDQYRNPVKALEFFGVQPTSTVVEIWPSAGYWAEILGPYLAKDGQYVAAAYDIGPKDTRSYRRRGHGALLTKLGNADLYGTPIVTTADKGAGWDFGPANSADFVLTFRNVHNWLGGDHAVTVFKAAHAALKPGGVLGVVEHRAKPGTPRAKTAKSGYMTEAHVIELAEAAGFKLAEKSELNANPKDDADHPNGVWTLLPSLRAPEGEKAKYKAIGESDRMTLKFVKLLN